MDNTTQNEQPVMVTEEVKQEEATHETEAIVEQAFGEDKSHEAKDPSFNCQACLGEGLLVNGNLCSACNGTGKV